MEAKFGNRQLQSYDVFNMAEILEDLSCLNLIEIDCVSSRGQMLVILGVLLWRLNVFEVWQYSIVQPCPFYLWIAPIDLNIIEAAFQE